MLKLAWHQQAERSHIDNARVRVLFLYQVCMYEYWYKTCIPYS